MNETDRNTIKAQRDLALCIAAASTIEEALPLCLDIAISVAGMDSGGIYLLNHSGDLLLACSKGLSDRFISEVSHIKADSDKAMVVMNRTPVYSTYDCLTASLLSEYPVTEGLLAVAIIPVIYQNSVIASLNISSHTVHEIPLISRENLETIAAQIGNAIARIKAEEEVREKQKELERFFGALKIEEEFRKYRVQLEERAEDLKSINRRLEKEIAERKQAEIALRESEERYRNLFENSSLGIFQTNINGTFITLNQSCARIFGYNSPDEVMREVREHVHSVYPEPSLRDKMLETLRNAQGMRKFEYNLLHKNGSILTVNLYIRLVRDVKGKELYLEGFLEDISEGKSKDEALRKIQSQQKAMLDNIPHIAWLKDKDSRFIAVNASFLKAFNLEAGEVEGKTDFDICPAELAEKYREDDRQVMISGKQFQLIEPLANKEGNIIWLDTIKTPILNDTGEIIGTTGIARDISERKIAEDKLRSANQQLLDIIEFLPDATFVIDKCKRVIAWNRAIEDMTGVKKEDIIGKSDYDYSVPFYGHRRPMLLDLIEKPGIDITDKYEYSERKGKILYGEKFFPYMFNGRGAYLWVTASPLFDLNGNLAGAIESIRDITERKNLEEAIRASEKNFRRLS
ncbi:MAG: PAS domain S-box protein, partial [Candidatus Eremiobacterota bacterium]